MVLKKNNFTFQGEHYLQTNGTAMGTKMAPSYANIFMGKVEKQLLECSIEKPLSWYRFIDDVDMKWDKGDQELQTFITNANNQHPTIKFTHETSNSTINFLDTSSTLSAGIINTDIYSKPTDTHQYLSPESCHPPHCTKSIPYSQALRIRRICSSEDTAKQRLGQLKGHLKRRGYKHKNIKNSFRKAESIPRSSLLTYKEKQKSKRIPCVLTYHPCLRNSFKTIRDHWTAIEKHSKLSKIFPEPPMIAFKQPNSLRNILVRADLSKPNHTVGNCQPCGDKRCKCCNQLQHSSTFHSKTTEKTYKIFCNVNCKSSNVIYVLECPICGLQYVGESMQPFHKRLNGHRSDLTKKPYIPVSQHFRLPDHDLKDFDHMKILVIEQDCTWQNRQRENREKFWIKTLGVLHPDGINRKK